MQVWVISILISIGLAVGIVYFLRIQQTMADVGGATYKTDNMIVVVKASDPAESILDAANYRFGYQTSVDQENNDKMLDDVQTVAGRELKLSEYDTVTDLANGLLSGQIEAAIYNEAFDGIIEESIEDYKDQVKILYQYGIETEIQQEDTNVEAPFNVYISGIDVSGPITTNSRSDVNIIMTVNPEYQEDPADHHAERLLRDDPEYFRRAAGQADPCGNLRGGRLHGDPGAALWHRYQLLCESQFHIPDHHRGCAGRRGCKFGVCIQRRRL